MRFSHLSSLPRVRRIAHVVAASARETSNNNAVQTLDNDCHGIFDYGAEEGEEAGASTMSAAEVETFWTMVEARLSSALRESNMRREGRETTPSKKRHRHRLGDEFMDEDARRRGRRDSSVASVGSQSPSRQSPTRSLAEARDLLRRFEDMTSTHRMALQWRDTRAFLGQEGGVFTCGFGRGLVHSGVWV